VDDDAAIRAVLRVLLEAHNGLQGVGETSDGEEAAVLAERYRVDVTRWTFVPLMGVESTPWRRYKTLAVAIRGSGARMKSRTR
jgi:hypothetical protein